MRAPVNPYKNFMQESYLLRERNRQYNQSKRLPWVDVAKGICNILVILRHYQFELFNLPFLNPLRMPLYFLLSGMFFKDYSSFKVFFSKKINNLILPCIFWLIIGYVLVNASILKGGEFKSPSLISNVFINRKIEINSTLWFLICLFSTSVLFYLLHKWLKGLWLGLGVLIVALIGNILSFYEIRLPLWIDSACTAMPFFYLGWYLNNGLPILSGKSKKNDIAWGALLILSSILIDCLLDEPHFYIEKNYTPHNPILVYLNSMLIVLGVLLLCKHVSRIPIVSYFGRYPIIVLCSHLLIIETVKVFSATLNLPAGNTFLLANAFGVLIGCWLFIPIAKTYLPYFTAQKNLFDNMGLRLLNVP